MGHQWTFVEPKGGESIEKRELTGSCRKERCKQSLHFLRKAVTRKEKYRIERNLRAHGDEAASRFSGKKLTGWE